MAQTTLSLEDAVAKAIYECNSDQVEGPNRRVSIPILWEALTPDIQIWIRRQAVAAIAVCKARQSELG